MPDEIDVTALSDEQLHALWESCDEEKFRRERAYRDARLCPERWKGRNCFHPKGHDGEHEFLMMCNERPVGDDRHENDTYAPGGEA